MSNKTISHRWVDDTCKSWDMDIEKEFDSKLILISNTDPENQLAREPRLC